MRCPSTSPLRFGAALVLVLAASGVARAQDRTLPGPLYFAAFEPYYAGEYRDALVAFRDAARQGLIGVDGRWVDSICYHAMTGECFYQLGDIARAVEQYEAALKLYLAYSDWMLKAEFPPALQPGNAVARARITWGPSTRVSKLARVPTKTMVFMGKLNNDQVIRQGGVIQPPEFRPLVVQEIVRCTALAIRRRHEILGPACKHDPLTDELVAALSRRPAPPNHWSQAWIDVQLGLAFASAGRTADALAALQSGILAAKQFDHQLTGTALLEIGKLFFEQGKYDPAAAMFFEATLSAAQFDQLDDVEEAFRFGAITHIVSGKNGVYPPLVTAAQWTRTRGSRLLQASLALSAAECSTMQGQTAPATAFLDRAKRAMVGNDLAASSAGVRFSYLTAQVNFQRGNVLAGNTNLAASLAHLKGSSRRLFQMGLADKLYVSGSVSPRIAEKLFAETLRDPTAKDWILHPMESLAVATTPHLIPLEHYFELMLLARREPEKALEIADQIRRHRFYSTLPLGGRLLALRWILEAPKEALDEKAQLLRQNFLAKYPAYKALSEKARDAEAALRKMPLVPEEKDVATNQAQEFTELAKLSATREAILSDLSLRREPSESSFPPIEDVKAIQKRMPAGQLTIAFFNTARAAYIFLLSKDTYGYQVVNRATQIRGELSGMLRAIGNYDGNFELTIKNLENKSWQDHAKRLSDMLLGEVKPDVWNKFNELVIVPDGILWYLPFEALPVPGAQRAVRFADKFQIRYAPTVSTTLPDGRGHRRVGNTAVVTGRMFPRDKDDVAALAFEDIQLELPGAVQLPGRARLPVSSSVFSSICDRLVVLDEVEESEAGPYAWSPMQIDRGRGGSTLADWLVLPFNAPQHVVVPGYQTAASDALKNGGSGEEIFLTVCGMMASGTRSVLISRWRVAGQSSFDLTREYVKQLSDTPAARAWRRSFQLARAGEIDADFEPRLKSAGISVPVRGDHPFFWAGYLLVDTGGDPHGEAEEP